MSAGIPGADGVGTTTATANAAGSAAEAVARAAELSRALTARLAEARRVATEDTGPGAGEAEAPHGPRLVVDAAGGMAGA
ncbi:hypothetical protein DTB58_12755, partial [Streptomyces griseus]